MTKTKTQSVSDRAQLITDLDDAFRKFIVTRIPDSLHGFDWHVDGTDGVILDSDSLDIDWSTTAIVNLENHISKFNFETRYFRDNCSDE